MHMRWCVWSVEVVCLPVVSQFWVPFAGALRPRRLVSRSVRGDAARRGGGAPAGALPGRAGRPRSRRRGGRAGRSSHSRRTRAGARLTQAARLRVTCEAWGRGRGGGRWAPPRRGDRVVRLSTGGVLQLSRSSRVRSQVSCCYRIWLRVSCVFCFWSRGDRRASTLAREACTTAQDPQPHPPTTQVAGRGQILARAIPIETRRRSG